MADDEHDYKVGPGRPPLHTRFRKAQSGNPGGRSQKKLQALLADALSEQVSSRSTDNVAKSPSARRSSISWSTNPPPPICGRPRCCST